MIRKNLQRATAILFLTSLFVCVAAAQDSAKSASQGAEQGTTASDPSSTDANAGIGDILAKTTEKAAHSAEKWGSSLGIGPKASFTLSVGFNFLALFVLCYVLIKSKVPQAFRERTAAIQKGIKEAQAASADAARRLSDIETRLNKMDQEVAEIRATAEREAAAEEARIRQAAEEDKQKVIQTAEAEIEAIARNARRELKGYAASLAVDLASRELQIDDSTDHALIREFASQLGKDGK
jgi:F-type H+-transporting ATPase subunit b